MSLPFLSDLCADKKISLEIRFKTSLHINMKNSNIRYKATWKIHQLLGGRKRWFRINCWWIWRSQGSLFRLLWAKSSSIQSKAAKSVSKSNLFATNSGFSFSHGRFLTPYWQTLWTFLPAQAREFHRTALVMNMLSGELSESQNNFFFWINLAALTNEIFYIKDILEWGSGSLPSG